MCLSGRKEQFAKLSSGATWTQGSNPCVSDFEKTSASNQLNKFILLIKEYFKIVLKFVKTEKFLINFALLPLIWTWLPVLAFNEKNVELKKFSLISGIMTVFLFSAVFLSWIVSYFPYIGELLGNIIHLLGILIYAGYLLYLIVYRNLGKRIYTSILDPIYNRINMLL